MFCNGKNWHSLLLHLYPTASVCILFGTQPSVRKRVKMKVLFAMWKHDTGCISFGTQPSVWKRVKMKVECLRWENLNSLYFLFHPTICGCSPDGTVSTNIHKQALHSAPCRWYNYTSNHRMIIVRTTSKVVILDSNIFLCEIVHIEIC